MYKAERRRQKDLDEREMEGLDDQLDDIRKLLDFKPSKAEEKNDLMNRLLNKYNNNNDSNGQSDKNKKNDNKKEVDEDDSENKLTLNVNLKAALITHCGLSGAQLDEILEDAKNHSDF